MNFSRIIFISILASTASCGSRDSSDLKIVNGSTVNSPIGVGLHAVAISSFDDEKVNCTGTLIDRYWVVTAAHCVRPHIEARVIFGLGTVAPRLVESTLALSFPHPDHTVNLDEDRTHTLLHDVALLRLQDPAPFYLKPVAIAQPGEVSSGLEVTLAGYGLTAKNARSRFLDKLRQTSTTIQQVDEEQKIIIYKSENGLNSACDGDSGGPMFIRDAGQQLRLIGSTHGPYVKSEASRRCLGQGVYFNLTQYRGWFACRMSPKIRFGSTVIDDASCLSEPNQEGCVKNLPCRLL